MMMMNLIPQRSWENERLVNRIRLQILGRKVNSPETESKWNIMNDIWPLPTREVKAADHVVVLICCNIHSCKYGRCRRWACAHGFSGDVKSVSSPTAEKTLQKTSRSTQRTCLMRLTHTNWWNEGFLNQKRSTLGVANASCDALMSRNYYTVKFFPYSSPFTRFSCPCYRNFFLGGGLPKFPLSWHTEAGQMSELDFWWLWCWGEYYHRSRRMW